MLYVVEGKHSDLTHINYLQTSTKASQVLTKRYLNCCSSKNRLCFFFLHKTLSVFYILKSSTRFYLVCRSSNSFLNEDPQVFYQKKKNKKHFYLFSYKNSTGLQKSFLFSITKAKNPPPPRKTIVSNEFNFLIRY